VCFFPIVKCDHRRVKVAFCAVLVDWSGIKVLNLVCYFFFKFKE
jgi:hypothetical protein